MLMLPKDRKLLNMKGNSHVLNSYVTIRKSNAPDICLLRVIIRNYKVKWPTQNQSYDVTRTRLSTCLLWQLLCQTVRTNWSQSEDINVLCVYDDMYSRNRYCLSG
jgi:hypothetical protein